MEPLPVAGSISFTKDAPVAQLTCNGSRLLLARSGDVTGMNPDFLSLLLGFVTVMEGSNPTRATNLYSSKHTPARESI